jgi:DnaK suppressor protein
MIVSLLQLMGFPMGNPVHSRAGETPPDHPSKTSDAAHGAIEHKQASPARRDQVNAKSGKEKKTKTVTAKPEAVAKPAPKPAKTAAKAAVKPAAKPAASAKTVAKPAKAPAKVSAKLVEKVAPKPLAKAAAKELVKAPVKAPAKAAKTASPVPTKPVKPVAKAADPKKVSTPMKTVATQPVPAPAPVAPAAVAQKAGRPSSRLAQLTVPSMAQSVASTAAKASYSQSIPSPVIVPVLPSSIKKDPKLANNWKTKPVAELTDADLMAMPDSEYMNEVQLAAFRLKLTTLKRDILNSAGETTEHLREDTSVVPDPADRATIEEEHALELRTRDRERKLLKKIEQSIARIDAGDYGYCDETGEPIGVGRLLARPTATLSLEAQQRRELKQKMFGD